MKLKEDERKSYLKLSKHSVHRLFQEKSCEDSYFKIVFDNYITLLKQSTLEEFWLLVEEITDVKWCLMKNYNLWRPDLFQEFATKLVSIRTKDGVHPNYFSITNTTVFFFSEKIPIQSSIDSSIQFLNRWKGTAKLEDPRIDKCFAILIQFLSVFNGNVDSLIEKFIKDFQIFIEKSREGNTYTSDVYITLVKYLQVISAESSDFLTERNFMSFIELSNLLLQNVRKATSSGKLFCTKCSSVTRHKIVKVVYSQLLFIENSKGLKITDWTFLKVVRANIRYVFLTMKDWKCSDAISIKNMFSCNVFNLLLTMKDKNDYLIAEKISILEVLHKNQENVVNSTLNNDFMYLLVLKGWETPIKKQLMFLVHIFILLFDKPKEKLREDALGDFLYQYLGWLKDHGSIIESIAQKPGTIFYGVTIPNYCLKEILLAMLEFVDIKWPTCQKLIYSIFDDLIKLETDFVKMAEYSLFLPNNSSKFIDVQKKILRKLDSSQNLHLGVLNFRVYLNEYKELSKINLAVVEEEDNSSLIKIVVETMEKENRLLTYLNDSMKNFKNFVKSLDKTAVKGIETKTAVYSMNEIGKHFHLRGFKQEAALVFGLLYDFSQKLNEQNGILKTISYFSENFHSIPYFQHNFPNYDMKSIIKKHTGTVYNNIETKTGEFHENLLCFMNIAFFNMKNNEIKTAQWMMKIIKIKLKETFDEKQFNILEAIYIWMEITLQYSVEEIATHQANRLGRLFMNFIPTLNSATTNDATIVTNLLFKSVEEFSIYHREFMNSEESPSPVLFMMFKFAVKQTLGIRAVMNLLLLVDVDFKSEICTKSVVSFFFCQSFVAIFL